jgi:pantoate--beta-alanine ligase
MTMVITTPDAMRSWTRAQHRRGRRVGFVPTMGALHDGHISLIDAARLHSDAVVVSIFVNPLQFDRPHDFDGYPRPLDDDLERCRRVGVDVTYAPTASTMYPPGFDTRVVPGALAQRLEGAARPGHFEGVTTVVTKLFGAVRPDVAAFGEKDFQQLALVRRLSADLDFGVEILPVATVREADGVAMSSRNRRLDAAARSAASCIPRALGMAAAMARSSGSTPAEVLTAAADAVDAEPGARLERVALVDVSTLHDLEHLEPRAAGRARLLIAVEVADVRLIDNIDPFDPPPGL